MSILGDQIRAQSADGAAARREKEIAVLHLMADLHYPVSKDGSVLDLTYLGPLISYHLVRCGWRPDPDHREIKSRLITAKGVISGAVEWVGVGEPDDPLAGLASMTMAQINSLPPNLKAEAIRRMGGPETEALPETPGWHVAPSLRIHEEPDAADGVEWTATERPTTP